MNNLYDIKYTNSRDKTVYLKRSEDLEYSHYADDDCMLYGYLVDCTDGETYLLFAPDMNSLRYLNAYNKIFQMLQRRVSEHDYEPIRDCIRPAFTCEFNEEIQDHKILRAPWEYYGRIFRVLPNRNYDDILKQQNA